MNTQQEDNQFGQGSNIDFSNNQNSNRYEESDENINQNDEEDADTNDDDSLNDDNASNQNNPNSDYNKQSLAPGRNPNIGGDESEYETSDDDDDFEEDEDEDNSAENGVANRRDSEELSRHDDGTRYSSPGWRKDADGNISV